MQINSINMANVDNLVFALLVSFVCLFVSLLSSLLAMLSFLTAHQRHSA